jgi:hypothetical protein
MLIFFFKNQLIIILMIFHLKGKTNNEMHNILREKETKIQIDFIAKNNDNLFELIKQFFYFYRTFPLVSYL